MDCRAEQLAGIAALVVAGTAAGGDACCRLMQTSASLMRYVQIAATARGFRIRQNATLAMNLAFNRSQEGRYGFGKENQADLPVCSTCTRHSPSRE